MSHSIEGKRIIVTGAGTGIGRATAELLMARGASLALWDINTEPCNELAASAGPGQLVSVCNVDVGDAVSVEAAVQQSVEVLGGLDGAFNNAGIGLMAQPIDQVTEAEFDRIVRINMKGVWLCMKFQINALRSSGGGAIVNNASVAGLVGLAMQGPYAGTKHAVIGMTKAAALEVASENIRINAICPGATQTPILKNLVDAGVTEEVLAAMSALKRLANPQEIAEAACWLLSEQSSFVTGTAMPVDGGWTAH